MSSALPFFGVKRRSRLDVCQLYLRTALSGFRARSEFASVRTFCMFIGYPRSGHSLVGSLLDAHPDAVIAHELDAIGFLDSGFGRLQLYDLILRNSRTFTEAGRQWTGYDYTIPGQWQGRYRELLVIGDKKGGRSTRRIHVKPELLDRLRAAVGVPLRMIHVVRNPFDNVATRHRKNRKPDVATTIQRHFALCDGVAAIKARSDPAEILDIRHEELIADPAGTMRRMVDFLDLEPLDEFLAATAGKVFASPRRSRDRIEWSDRDKADIQERVGNYDFLSGYTFDS